MTIERIEQIRGMITNNPDWHRSMLSQKLCELWEWKGENGKYKDISCRDILRALDATGIISLPPPHINRTHKRSGDTVIKLRHDTTPLSGALPGLLPIKIEPVTSKSQRELFKSYIAQYHYLGYDRSIGENIKYAVYSNSDIPLASIMFGSSAWACMPRDEYIGWDNEQRRTGLRFTTNNSRFLIYPWIRISHLASHILSRVCRRLPQDWKNKYGHAVYLVETFVERDRFRGICYQAANWQYVGHTTGRGRNSTSTRAVLPIKDVYVYPLDNGFRKKLIAEATP